MTNSPNTLMVDTTQSINNGQKDNLLWDMIFVSNITITTIAVMDIFPSQEVVEKSNLRYSIARNVL